MFFRFLPTEKEALISDKTNDGDMEDSDVEPYMEDNNDMKPINDSPQTYRDSREKK